MCYTISRDNKGKIEHLCEHSTRKVKFSSFIEAYRALHRMPYEGDILRQIRNEIGAVVYCLDEKPSRQAHIVEDLWDLSFDLMEAPQDVHLMSIRAVNGVDYIVKMYEDAVGDRHIIIQRQGSEYAFEVDFDEAIAQLTAGHPVPA